MQGVGMMKLLPTKYLVYVMAVCMRTVDIDRVLPYADLSHRPYRALHTRTGYN